MVVVGRGGRASRLGEVVVESEDVDWDSGGGSLVNGQGAGTHDYGKRMAQRRRARLAVVQGGYREGDGRVWE